MDFILIFFLDKWIVTESKLFNTVPPINQFDKLIKSANYKVPELNLSTHLTPNQCCRKLVKLSADLEVCIKTEPTEIVSSDKDQTKEVKFS